MAVMTRDMTEKQYRAALRRHDFHDQGFLGYVDIGHGVMVSVWNAGVRRRDRLALLLRERDRLSRERGR